MLSKSRAVGVDCFLVFSCRVVLLFVFELVKQCAVNSHGLVFRNATLPNFREHDVKFFLWSARDNFVDERNILTRRKDKRKFSFGCREDIIDGVVGPIDNLDIFHAL